MPECIRLSGGRLGANISSLGAELKSLRDREGIERLWRGDPAWWSGQAPVLFPVAGSYREQCYTLNGKRYDMPKHGFARGSEFKVESAGLESAVFLLEKEHPGFPFKYQFRAIFEAVGDSLRVSYAVRNLGDKPMYYGLGSHEAFACPEGIEHMSVVFDEPEDLTVNLLDGAAISHETKTLAVNARELRLKKEYFVPDALIFLSLKSRGVTLRSDMHDRSVRVDFPGMDHLLIWQKPGAPYVCIEPWCNAPDFADTDYEITRKTGIITLQPGCEDVRTHVITLS